VAPAFSILVFTTASGAGYGLLFLLGLLAPLGLLPGDRWFGFTALALAFGLVGLGLISSTLHLGHPERAWRALSQWRSSWLSREGVMALATFPPAGLFGLAWVWFGETDGIWTLFGLLAALLAVATVACTAMIYASLKPIRQWHNGFVVPVYLWFALMTGALWVNGLLLVFGFDKTPFAIVTLLTVALAWMVKALYWRHIDETPPESSVESATGLGGIGRVRLLDPPHTEENYLVQEMGYRIGRKHARKLRLIAVGLGCAVPLVSVVLALASDGAVAAGFGLLAACGAIAGSFVERWLFFAEATHRVTLYYGARRA
jgi:DMSO reductase anchor subunit